jgi:hypothetical protein
MTPTQQQFISLLKCGLWGAHPTAAEFANADWPAIVKIAKEQCVTALITDAMNELAANNVSIDKAILYKANFDAVRIAQRNAQLNATLVEITELLNSNNVPSVILKGQGVAQNYRNPNQRMSGDIDLYVGEKNYAKAVAILQEWDVKTESPEAAKNEHKTGTLKDAGSTTAAGAQMKNFVSESASKEPTTDTSSSSAITCMQPGASADTAANATVTDASADTAVKATALLGPIAQLKNKQYLKEVEKIPHHQLTHNSVVIELHRHADKLSNPLSNRYFQNMTKHYLLDSCKQLKSFTINTTNINLPPSQFNALYLFNHIFHHFLVGGIGFRQLSDWVRYLYLHCNEIDTCALNHNLYKTGLLRAWKIFGFIAVDTLGLPADCFPFYERKSKFGEDVLESVLWGGNFGFFAPDRKLRPKGYFAGKWFSFKGKCKRALEMFEMFPGRTTTYYLKAFLIGIRQIFLDNIFAKKDFEERKK